MTRKRRNCFEGNLKKRNKNQNSVSSHFYKHFENLSISTSDQNQNQNQNLNLYHQHPNKIQNQNQNQNQTQTHWKNASFLNSNPNKINHNSTHQSSFQNSFQYQSDWTQVVRKGMQNQSNSNQSAYNRYTWLNNSSHQQSFNNNSQPLIFDPSRSIVNLPQRTSFISPNTFAVLNSNSNQVTPSNPQPVPPQSKSNKTQPLRRSQRNSKKKALVPAPISTDQDKQIDIVLDTNILLSHLHFLRAVIPLLSPVCRILVPQAVVSELDMQKNRQQPVQVYQVGRCHSLVAMGCLAREATNWLLSITKLNSSKVLVQKIEDEEEDLNRPTDADTRILKYTHKLFLQAKSENLGAVTALLSNDNILRLRAQSEGICCLAMSDFHHNPRQMMSKIRNFIPKTSISKPQPSTSISSSKSLSPPPQTTIENSNSIEKPKEPPTKSWLPSAQNAQFTFTSLLPNINKPDGSDGLMGPDQELIKLKFHIRQPRPCRGCQSSIQSTLPVSPDKVHHYCPMCCEVVCRGCMRVTGCDWDCSGPFHGKVCATMKCCVEGRASILLELLGQLDCYYLTSHHKLSFKHGPKITHLYGDSALTQYLQATMALLMTHVEQDERLEFLDSILMSSTLLDVLSQTLLSSSFLKWHLRSEVFKSSIKLIKTMFQSLTRPWSVINSEYIKSTNTKLLSINNEEQRIVWNRVIEKGHEPNATTVKIEKLQESFPSLMAEVKDVLCNRARSSSTMFQNLLDNAVYVPLCYILEHLFNSAVQTKKNQPEVSSTLPGDIEVIESLPPESVQLVEALLDLKKLYDSNVISQTSHSHTSSNSGPCEPKSTKSSNEQEPSDLEGEKNQNSTQQERVKKNHAVKNLKVNGQVRDEIEVEYDADKRLDKETHSKENNGVQFQGGLGVKSQTTVDVIEKQINSKCSVGGFFDKIDALSISSDRSESDDAAVEVIHLT